jgi:peptidoglycan hydrolase CwlO-like protein
MKNIIIFFLFTLIVPFSALAKVAERDSLPSYRLQSIKSEPPTLLLPGQLYAVEDSSYAVSTRRMVFLNDLLIAVQKRDWRDASRLIVAYEAALTANDKAINELVEINKNLQSSMLGNFEDMDRLMEELGQKLNDSKDINSSLKSEISNLKVDLRLQQKALKKEKRKAWVNGMGIGAVIVFVAQLFFN